MKLIDKLQTLRISIYREQRIQEKAERLRKLFPEVKFLGGTFADDDCSFDGPVVLTDNVRLTKSSIGKYSYIASNSKLSRCTIGSFCSIGPEVMAGLGKHPASKFVSTHPSFYSPMNSSSPVTFVDVSRFDEFERILIGNDVWVGARVTIIDGVTIGDGAIIAAGAVVTKDVAPYTIVGGVPAREIRKRFTKEQIDFLLDFRWWEKDDEWIKSHAYLFNDIEKFIKEVK